jgi:hypothetical protein
MDYLTKKARKHHPCGGSPSVIMKVSAPEETDSKKNVSWPTRQILEKDTLVKMPFPTRIPRKLQIYGLFSPVAPA